MLRGRTPQSVRKKISEAMDCASNYHRLYLVFEMPSESLKQRNRTVEI